MQESERLLIAANKAKKALREWHLTGSVWVHDDSIKWELHPISNSATYSFDTLEALEEWVDSLQTDFPREILHRKFSL